MKPPPFKYIEPDTLEQALELLAEYGDEAKLLAGGQSLIPAMNFRVMQPAVLIDLNRVRALEYIARADDGSLSIGAMTRQHAVEISTDVEQVSPLLYEAMPHIAHPQIRNRGTIGGSLAHADPAAELPVVAIAAGARLRVTGASGDRWIDAEDFFEGMFTTALAPEEILVEASFPAQPSDVGSSFMETSRRRGDYAMMGVAVQVRIDPDGECTDAQLVYLNAGDGPVAAPDAALLLIGQQPRPEIFAAAAVQAADNEIDPMGNIHASIPFQRHLAKVLTERSLEQAFERAGQSEIDLRAEAQ